MKEWILYGIATGVAAAVTKKILDDRKERKLEKEKNGVIIDVEGEVVEDDNSDKKESD